MKLLASTDVINGLEACENDLIKFLSTAPLELIAKQNLRVMAISTRQSIQILLEELESLKKDQGLSSEPTTPRTA